MALCSYCWGQRWIWSGPFHDGQGPRAGKMIPCPTCGGVGVTSCCEGPGGAVADVPTDPNAGGST